jgi:hypothetical protein
MAAPPQPDHLLLKLHIATCVPLRVAELKRFGGPAPGDFRRVCGTINPSNVAETIGGYVDDFASRGDVLLFGSGKKGEVAELVNKLVDAIAVLSFVPGGVTLFGEHFEEAL